MPLKVIEIGVGNIDGAAEEIIDFLEHTRQDGVIYLDGWFGLGASSMLKAVVERCRSSSSGDATRKAAGLDKIIHIDCSLWQSKRSLQKVVAEELKLPREVMALFDQGDEEDDFDGVQPAARGVIPQVKWAILDELINCKFLVVFHNGSGSYADLWECGVPVLGVRNKRVLWTSRGRFLFHGSKDDDVKELAGLSDVAISIYPLNVQHLEDFQNNFRRSLHAEAKEVARYSGVPELDTKIVLECILYNMALIRKGNDDNNWGTHAANYWVCDGIIQDTNGCGRSPWEIGDALHRNMNLDWHQDVVDGMLDEVLCDEYRRHRDRWVSVSGQHAMEEVQGPTSLFCTQAIIEGGMFKHLDRSRLHVLHLVRCTFSFSSPPFLSSCSSLRFLLLDHCKDENNGAPSRRGEQDNNQGSDGACFLKLWVLELSYTNWYWLLSKEMLDLMTELRELNVIGPGNWSMSCLHSCSGVGSNSRKLLKLRVVGEPKDGDDNMGNTGGHIHRQPLSFPDLSSWQFLKTIILDGCCELEEIGYNTLPPSLESFSFTSNVATKIKSISFRGCAMLKSLLLKGLFDMLEELDISSTSVKTLDLSEVQALHLKRLFLLGCEKLHAILWPEERSKVGVLEVLRIDTTHAAWANKEDKSDKQAPTSSSTRAESSSAAVLNTFTNFDSYISLRDPRVFRSLMSTKLVKDCSHIEISSTGGHHKGISQQVQARNFRSAAGNVYTNEIISAFKDNSQIASANGDVVDALVIRSMWTCPLIPVYSGCANCYISIHDETPTKFRQDDTVGTRQQISTTLPGFVSVNAKILHLHDCLSITCIPGRKPNAEVNLKWENLQWCQLEICPNLDGSVFTAPSLYRSGGEGIFYSLKTFWASQLSKARYIWDWSATKFFPGDNSFEDLTFLHLDYCPRLVHVLPLYTSNTRGCRSLETLEIICCGELREVFPCVPESQQQELRDFPRDFPRLKRIHLHELPALQHIYRGKMLAPKLETVKIRGCWSLKRLPAVRDYTELDEDREMTPTVDCEKDWWDGLEWDGEEAGHHPSYYKATHSAFYKKTLLRATVLR